ncbi:ParB/RepB/Spo0J family partition protein [Candidatus Parcubacteria bacterium]|nr:MAG: ParB/RepB/Spo0J family partition protein [Candidatus Parcubacteria bacterium]
MPALGKGLGALIPNKSKKDNEQVNYWGDEETIDKQNILEVPLEDIVSNPWQPRTHFDRDKLEELAESIKQHGILQPLVVSKETKGYQLIAGERRFKAAQLLGFAKVPVIVKAVSDRDKLELSIIENIQRRDLNPIETANAYQRLMEEFGLTYDEVAEQVGKAPSTVNNFLRILKLPLVIKEAVEEGKISLSHAKQILSYQTKSEQIKIFKKILKENLKSQDLIEMAKHEAIKAKQNKPRDPVLASWEDKLTKNLGAKTTIQKRGERGEITIKFFSHAELKNILDKLEK